MAAFQVDRTLDITEEVCPITFVMAKIALEEMETGQILQVHMNSGRPARNVPRSLAEEGHKILALEENSDGTYDLYVQKAGGA